MNRTVRIILGVVALLAVAGGSFFGGTLYGKNQTQSAFVDVGQADGFPGGAQGGARPNGQGMRGGQGAVQGGLLVGQIQEIGDGVMVITGTDGKQTQVKVTDTTLIEKQASVTLADLETGETVMVSGSKADDGSITARSVQVGALGRFGGGAPGAAPEGAPAP